MGNLYNAIFGINRFGPLLLSGVLGLDPTTIPRLRDCFINTDRDRIVVMTRTGGVNREEYRKEAQPLRDHPLFAREFNSPVDSTYAYFEFRFPDELRDDLLKAADLGAVCDPDARWKEMFTDLKDNRDSPLAQQALAVGQQMLGPIVNSLEGGPSGDGQPKVVVVHPPDMPDDSPKMH